MKQALALISSLIICFNAFGQAPSIQWQISLGGGSEDVGESILKIADGYIISGYSKRQRGGYIVAGFSRSTDGDISGNHGAQDFWVVKLNDTGGIQWQKSLGGSGDDEAYSIKPTTDGGFIVAGFSMSNDGDVTSNHGGCDYWVVKLDDAGALQWQMSLGGNQYEIAFSIVQTADGYCSIYGNK